MTPASSSAADDPITAILRERLPLARRGQPLDDEMRLGAQGLGFDSVAIVEIILECEAALGIVIPATIFDEGPMTVGRLRSHAARALSPGMVP